MTQQRETLTPDDLSRVFIRAQDTKKHEWVTVDALSCTSEQFNAWAKSRAIVQGDTGPWSLPERAAFCDQLWQAGELHLLKHDIEDE